MAGEVLSGPERPRRWSSEEKAKLVAETLMPGASVTEMSRRYGISRSLLHAWRREATRGAARGGDAPTLAELVPVMTADDAEPPKQPVAVTARSSMGAKPTGTIEFALPGGVQVTVRGRIEDVRELRERLGIAPFDPTLDRPATISVDETANRLGICVGSVYKLIREGVLLARQLLPSAPWRFLWPNSKPRRSRQACAKLLAGAREITALFKMVRR